MLLGGFLVVCLAAHWDRSSLVDMRWSLLQAAASSQISSMMSTENFEPLYFARIMVGIFIVY